MKFLKPQYFTRTHRVRGTLNTMLVVATSGGTLIGLLAGHFLGYVEAPRYFLLFPVLFIVLYSFMPETPYYLMKINRMEVCTRAFFGYCFFGPSAFFWHAYLVSTNYPFVV